MKKKNVELMDILTGTPISTLDLILKKKMFYLSKADASEHFIKIERELLSIIY